MTTANKLTILRIIMVPFCMGFLLVDNAAARGVGIALFILASLTDCLDGYIARHYNQITTFGKFMDPLADKMLVTAAFLCLVHFGRMSVVALMLILAREFAVSGLRMVAVSEGKVIAAGWWGKVKTVMQMVTIVAAFLLMYDTPLGTETSVLITDILVWISVAATVMSGLEYIVKNRALLKMK